VQNDPDEMSAQQGCVRPTNFALYGARPNPFNPEMSIAFGLPVQTGMKLVVFDMLGQRVRVLVDGLVDAGRGSVNWDGRDDEGRVVSSSVYMARMQAGSYRRLLK
jgi:hypothetical protein